MSHSKRLVVNLSEALFNEFDDALRKDSKKRSEFIREAIILYIEKKKESGFIDEMKRGYVEMAKLNLEISEMGLEKDFNDFSEYEAKLSESDFSNDNNSKKRRYILC